MADDPVVEVRDVYKTFVTSWKPSLWGRIRGEKPTSNRVEVLKGVDLTVSPGQTVVIIGSSGSGKSTLLRCINKLETIDDGRIYVNSHLIGYEERGGKLFPEKATVTARKRTDIGMVFQQFNLFANKTALGNVMAPLKDVKRMSTGDSRAKALEHLEMVGILDQKDNFPSKLSGGQKQRVAIARALAMAPSVMLFDEPTSALDPELVGEVLTAIKQIAQQGTTMVIVTHEMQFAREIADKVVVMDGGRIVEQGPPSIIFANPQHSKTKALLGRYGLNLPD